jgi:hypothetical protein
MPSQVPRSDTSKKHEQLLRRIGELKHAIRSGVSRHKLTKAAEGVRAAQLSLLKARLHWIEDAQIRRSGSRFTRDVGKAADIKEAIDAWTKMPLDLLLAHAKDLTGRCS